MNKDVQTLEEWLSAKSRIVSFVKEYEAGDLALTKNQQHEMWDAYRAIQNACPHGQFVECHWVVDYLDEYSSRHTQDYCRIVCGYCRKEMTPKNDRCYTTGSVCQVTGDHSNDNCWGTLPFEMFVTPMYSEWQSEPIGYKRTDKIVAWDDTVEMYQPVMVTAKFKKKVKAPPPPPPYLSTLDELEGLRGKLHSTASGGMVDAQD